MRLWVAASRPQALAMAGSHLNKTIAKLRLTLPPAGNQALRWEFRVYAVLGRLKAELRTEDRGTSPTLHVTEIVRQNSLGLMGPMLFA